MTRDRNIALFAFIAGAAVGTLAIALTSSKSTHDPMDLAGSHRRARNNSEFLARRGTRAWEPFKVEPSDPPPAIDLDLRGKAAGVWQDTMDRTESVTAEPLGAWGDIASDHSVN